MRRQHIMRPKRRLVEPGRLPPIDLGLLLGKPRHRVHEGLATPRLQEQRHLRLNRPVQRVHVRLHLVTQLPPRPVRVRTPLEDLGVEDLLGAVPRPRERCPRVGGNIHPRRPREDGRG